MIGPHVRLSDEERAPVPVAPDRQTEDTAPIERLSHPSLPGLAVAVGAIADLGRRTDDLTPDERALSDEMSEAGRRAEWIAGRLAAHAALAAAGAPAGLSVLRTPSGVPRLDGPDASDHQCSISHNEPWAAAAAIGPGTPWAGCGIDLVAPGDHERLTRLSERILKPSERALAAQTDHPILALAWGLREAVAKATETGMFRFALAHVHIDDIDDQRQRIHATPGGVDAAYLRLSDDSLVILAAVTPACVAFAQKTAKHNEDKTL